MSARQDIIRGLGYVSGDVGDETPEDLVDAYRAEILREAADRFEKLDRREAATLLRRMSFEDGAR